MKKNKNRIKTIEQIKSFFIKKKNQNIFGLIFILLSIYLFISFTSFFINWKKDFDVIHANSWISIILNPDIETSNTMKKLGALFSYLFIYRSFGISSYIFPIFLLFAGIRLLGYKLLSLKKFLRESIWGLIWIPIFIAYFFKKSQIFAGSAGIHCTEFLTSTIGSPGVFLVLFFTVLIFITLKFEINIKYIIAILFTKKDSKNNIQKEDKKLNEEENNIETNIKDTPILKKELKVKPVVLPTSKLIVNKDNSDIDININNTRKEEVLNKNEIQEKLEKIDDFDPTLELSSYKFPNIDLLKNYGTGEINIDKGELEDNKQKIVDTLANYKIGIDSITATIGPTITLYEIVPEAGVKISKIKNLEDDIALGLSAIGIRIIAPIPGKGTIGIEVPNNESTTVSMSTVIKSNKFQNAEMDLPIAFGKNISNETFVVDLAKMPHLLMAGATGQGKSVGLNTILTSLLYKKHPSQIKFVLVDPKKVELTLFNKIEKHFLAKLPETEEAIITDTKKVVNTINSLCIEMDQRYELLKIAMCRNIKEYNNKFISRKLNPNNGHRFLPYIVLVIDEFADLIMTAGKEIETPIARLAQLARAIGIHLIIATQRPSVNVITGIIKANFPARAAFRVTSRIDSRTILDSGGADQLIGKGDMLFSNGNDMIRLQCAFIDTPEVEKICEFIGNQKSYPEAYTLPEYKEEIENNQNDINLNERDVLFDDVARLFVTNQKGSTSNIQRRFKIGYNRAGRIVDELLEAGIIGKDLGGGKGREVIIKNFEDLEVLLNKLNHNE